MEFLRFGSTIPGEYWGCCAVDVIQNFKQDPDAKASIQLVSGDGGYPNMNEHGEVLFAGPTYRAIFWQRLRIGTFNLSPMPNHAFLAILTESQIKGTFGKKWLAILREAGFEFLRAVTNSVYSGGSLAESLKDGKGESLNYVFGLFRNIGSGAGTDVFTPPKEWTDLPQTKTEAWKALVDPQFATVGPKELAKTQFAEDTAIWQSREPLPLLTEKELDEQGVPVVYAGLRSKFPQQPREIRKDLLAAENKANKPAPFSKANAV